MKKLWKQCILLCSIVVLALGMYATASAAASSNPLKNMPTKSASIVGVTTGKGCDYFTPEYTTNFKMTATSSNKKVATVKVYNFQGNGTYFKGYEVKRKGYGSTNIKVTVKIGGKTYKKTCKYTYYKYENPFSKLKIGTNTYTTKMKKSTLELPQSKLKGRLSFQLKSGYKLVNISCTYGKGTVASPLKNKVLKNRSKLPSNVVSIYMTIQNTKTKANVAVCIKPQT